MKQFEIYAKGSEIRMGCKDYARSIMLCRRTDCKTVALKETTVGSSDDFDGLCREHWNEQLEQFVAQWLAGKDVAAMLRDLVKELYMLQRAVRRCRRY